MLVTFLTFSVYPSSHRANICKKGCIFLSRILYWEPINLASCILDEMIVQEDPLMSKKEVIPYGILITKICQRVGVEFPVNSSFLEPMGLIDNLGIEVKNRLRMPSVLRKRCAIVELRENLVKVTQIQL